MSAAPSTPGTNTGTNAGTVADTTAPRSDDLITLGGGCFWCTKTV